MKTREMEVFLFKNMKYGFETLHTQKEFCNDEYTLIGSGSTTITMLPDAEVVNAQIEALKKAKQTLLAECQLQVESIDDRIQSLLAIGHEEAQS